MQQWSEKIQQLQHNPLLHQQHQQQQQQEIPTEIELQTEEVVEEEEEGGGEGGEITFMVQVDKDGKQELVQLSKDQARKQLEQGKVIKNGKATIINLFNVVCYYNLCHTILETSAKMDRDQLVAPPTQARFSMNNTNTMYSLEWRISSLINTRPANNCPEDGITESSNLMNL